MNKKIVLLDIKELKQHEKVSDSRVAKLLVDIKKRKKIINPILVSNDGNIILDGHHRVAALKILGLTKVPAEGIDYLIDNVKLNIRCKKTMNKLLKEILILKVKQGNIFPIKTTRHVYRKRVKNILVPVDKLK